MSVKRPTRRGFVFFDSARGVWKVRFPIGTNRQFALTAPTRAAAIEILRSGPPPAQDHIVTAS